MIVSETSSKFICKCDFCGKDFSDYKSNRNHNPPKFCSSKCYHDSTRSMPIYKICEYCGKEIVLNAKTKNRRFCSIKCSNSYRCEHTQKKTYLKKGYKCLWIKGRGDVQEHIYLMEQHLGRRLRKDEVVHHKDFNKLNNSISNLQVMTRAEHSLLHRKYETNLYGRSKNLKNSFNKGHIPSNARKVIRLEDNKIYESTGECAKDINGNSQCIWKVCKGLAKSYKGFHFCYLEGGENDK